MLRTQRFLVDVPRGFELAAWEPMVTIDAGHNGGLQSGNVRLPVQLVHPHMPWEGLLSTQTFAV